MAAAWLSYTTQASQWVEAEEQRALTAARVFQLMFHAYGVISSIWPKHTHPGSTYMHPLVDTPCINKRTSPKVKHLCQIVPQTKLCSRRALRSFVQTLGGGWGRWVCRPPTADG